MDCVGYVQAKKRPYHPQTNDKVERINQTVISMLNCLLTSHNTKWRRLICAYNSSTNCATGCLIFGR